MLFYHEGEQNQQVISRTVYLYGNGLPNQKPISHKLLKKKSSFRDIAKLFRTNHIRLYNSEGSEYFEEDLDFIKTESVLYVSRGEQFDPGSCFAQYELLSLLGQGGFGKVFLAKHKQTGQKYALKIIKTQNIGSVSDIDSIFVQAEILKSLNHQNIVKVHKCLTMKNMEVVIIMQYLQGGDLLKYVVSMKSLDQGIARNIVKQVVKGILYCHKNNLTHRDLKLENILLVNSQEKKIKIIDFGIAGATNSVRVEQLETGSLSYMAPECFITPKNYRFDGKVDVWAIGVMLYAMLCGELPFKGGNPNETIEAIKEGTYTVSFSKRKHLSRGCLDFLAHCLVLDPNNRVSAEDLSNHKWLDDNYFFSDGKFDTAISLDDFEVYKTKEKIKDISNKAQNQNLPRIKVKASSTATSPKAKGIFIPFKKKGSMKTELPKSRFR